MLHTTLIVRNSRKTQHIIVTMRERERERIAYVRERETYECGRDIKRGRYALYAEREREKERERKKDSKRGMEEDFRLFYVREGPIFR